MKRIALLSVPDPKYPHPSDPNYEMNRVDYRQLVEQAIRLPLDRQAGASISEMRQGLRVLDALDACKGSGGAEWDVLELEDADWEHLKQKVERMPWVMVDRRFVQFYDDIFQATEAPRDPTRVDGLAAT